MDLTELHVHVKIEKFCNHTFANKEVAHTYQESLSIQNKLSLKEQVQRFPGSNISDTADRLRYKAGLPTLNSFSSSEEEEKFKKLRTSTESSDLFTSNDNLDIWSDAKMASLKNSFKK